MSGIASLLSRSFYFQHGNFRVFPISTLCLLERQELEKVLQSNLLKTPWSLWLYGFSANKTTKEKFLVDLQREEDFDLLHTTKRSYDATTATNLWGDSNEGLRLPQKRMRVGL